MLSAAVVISSLRVKFAGTWKLLKKFNLSYVIRFILISTNYKEKKS